VRLGRRLRGGNKCITTREGQDRVRWEVGLSGRAGRVQPLNCRRVGDVREKRGVQPFFGDCFGGQGKLRGANSALHKNKLNS